MKKIIFFTILISSILAMQIFSTYDELIKDYSYLRHCKVIEKVDYVKITKHKSNYSSNPERAFIVMWEDNKKIDEIEVTPNTFFSTKEGDNISFYLTHEKYAIRHPFFGVIMLMIALVSYFAEAVLICVGIGFVINRYIFDKK